MKRMHFTKLRYAAVMLQELSSFLRPRFPRVLLEPPSRRNWYQISDDVEFINFVLVARHRFLYLLSSKHVEGSRELLANQLPEGLRG